MRLPGALKQRCNRTGPEGRTVRICSARPTVRHRRAGVCRAVLIGFRAVRVNFAPTGPCAGQA